ncbi:MAG: hypothetical protein KC912_04430, partial [Proteobacteria bacterium]|nr:hypothetical protein [Pseudomonadota bacterium]
EAEPLAVRGFAARLTGGVAASLPMRSAGAGRFGLTRVDVDSMQMLDPQVMAQQVLGEDETEEEETRQPRAATPSRRSRGAWLVRKQIAELAPLARTATQRRALKRAVEEIELLPESEQTHAARRIVRRIKGPSARIATSVVDRAVERVDMAPAAVARARAIPQVKKGLRRILGSSPAMATLDLEARVAEEVQGQQPAPSRTSRTAQVERVRPTSARRTVARVVREARSQLQTGRAGPPSDTASTVVDAPIAAGPARPVRRRPTARAMARTLAAPRAAAEDVRRGFAASAPSPIAASAPTARPDALRRASARSQAGVRVTSAGAPMVSPSATSYIAARQAAPASSPTARQSAAPSPIRVRRSRAVQAEPSSWLTPGAVEPTEAAVESIPVSRRVSAARSAVSPVARASAVPAPTASVASTLVRRSASPSVTPAAARAVLRAEPTLRRDAEGRGLLSPSPVGHVPSAKRGFTARRSRLVAPTSTPIQFAAQEAEVEEVSATTPRSVTAKAAPRRAARTQMARTESAPVLRAAARGAARTDRVGVARKPTAHVSGVLSERVARPEVRGVAAPSVAPRSVARRSRLVAPSAVSVSPAVAEAEVDASSSSTADSREGRVAPTRTASVTERAVARRAATEREVVPTLRAVARASAPSVARVDARGSSLVAPQPTRYVTDSADPLVPETAVRAQTVASARLDAKPRTLRTSVPDTVLASSAQEEAGGEQAEAAPRKVQAAGAVERRVRKAIAKQVAPAGAAAHAVRRAAHAGVEARPLTSKLQRVPAVRTAGQATQPARRAAASSDAAPTAVRRPSKAMARGTGARRSLIPRAVAPITLEIPTFDAPAPAVEQRVPTAARARQTEASVDAVVARVTTAIRAALRGEEPTIVLDAARRTLRVRSTLQAESPVEVAGSRLGAPPSPQRPRFAPQAPAQTMVSAASNDVADEAPVDSGFGATSSRPARASRGTASPARQQRSVSTPANRILRRNTASARPSARWTRVRDDGAVVSVPQRDRATARARGATRTARTARASGQQELLRQGAGFGSSDMNSLEPTAFGPSAAEGVSARPLHRTLGQMDPATAPLPGSAASPGWAQRAVHGTAATSREQLRATKALRTDTGLFAALAKSNSTEDVVRVILERADGVSAVRKELGAPAAALVERIVRTRQQMANTDQVLRPGQNNASAAPELDTLPGNAPARRGRSRSARTVRSMPGSFLSSSQSSEGVGASGVMKLAGKLQQLIHLAESERRLKDAQAQVRMSQEKPDSGGITGPAGAPDDEAPDIGALQRDVLQAVMTELDLLRNRRQEDPDGLNRWW